MHNFRKAEREALRARPASLRRREERRNPRKVFVISAASRKLQEGLPFANPRCGAALRRVERKLAIDMARSRKSPVKASSSGDARDVRQVNRAGNPWVTRKFAKTVLELYSPPTRVPIRSDFSRITMFEPGEVPLVFPYPRSEPDRYGGRNFCQYRGNMEYHVDGCRYRNYNLTGDGKEWNDRAPSEGSPGRFFKFDPYCAESQRMTAWIMPKLKPKKARRGVNRREKRRNWFADRFVKKPSEDIKRLLGSKKATLGVVRSVVMGQQAVARRRKMFPWEHFPEFTLGGSVPVGKGRVIDFSRIRSNFRILVSVRPQGSSNPSFDRDEPSFGRLPPGPSRPGWATNEVKVYRRAACLGPYRGVIGYSDTTPRLGRIPFCFLNN